MQTIVSAIIMYLVMFVMIDRLSSFYNNLNMVYMTGCCQSNRNSSPVGGAWALCVRA